MIVSEELKLRSDSSSEDEKTLPVKVCALLLAAFSIFTITVIL